jgi:hypothetical protein
MTFDYARVYYKCTNVKETHNGVKYKRGLVIDPIKFNPTGSCLPGGIYFTNAENIFKFINSNRYLREVTIPTDASVYLDPEGDKWKADKVIIGARRDLKLVSTYEYLISIGADIHAGDDGALRSAASNGHLEVVKYLIKVGANVHGFNDDALRWAAYNGHLQVVKYLKSLTKELQ